jgi:uncharacterized membrane protein
MECGDSSPLCRSKGQSADKSVHSKLSNTPRLLALDWLRGFAVLVMVECHTFNALMSPPFRSTRWFSVLNQLDGLVAPAFLLVSGAVMGLNLQSRWDKVVNFGSAWRKLWRRIGEVFLVAYLLHFPGQLLWQFAGPQGPHLVAEWTKADILQCIAASLALIMVLVPLTRLPKLHRIVCLVVGVVAATSVQPVSRWAIGSSLPLWLLNYFWPADVGTFPLVPWSAYLLMGVWLGPAMFFQQSRSQQTLRAVLAAGCFIAASTFMGSTQTYDAPFVFSRMGWVMIGLAACCWLGRPVRGTQWLLEFGQLSLWSYTVHLIIVYSILGSLFGPRFSPVITALWMIGVLFVTTLIVRWRAKSLQRQAALRMMPAT